MGLKFICNVGDWLQQSWIDEAFHSSGFKAPLDLFSKENQSLHEEDIKAVNSGYSLDQFYYTLIERQHLSFELLEIPGVHQGQIHWWITRMTPGQFMPVHRDPRITTKKNIQRYWMPWTDWECGHIFCYEDIVISEYQKGDLFLMENPDALHGAANIGLTPRMSLNIGVERL